MVFPLLVFFLTAGTIARLLDRDVTFVDTATLDSAPLPDASCRAATGECSFAELKS